ncbi:MULTISPECIES: hypothetical protein [unclassified Massilia]|uniref:hypothetical protein n=1 Tax=unclassified Massilia TaxID=2609279 RepID=UPI00177DC9A2|nr:MULTISPECIES: hypothetical protein [unclassified Massilia]MBD8531496.1 hypothetical protein [Massilia sp. CFBP 13647]MBD8673708.1 hypothetical protein [Massilia sp. CFBP 13721]
MIPFINPIDRLLQAAPSRYAQAYARRLNLSASDRAFVIALDATVTPSAIVFIASRVGFEGGTVEFSTSNGTPLTVDGDVATLVPAAMMGPTCEIVVTVTYQGEPYVARQSVTKQLAFNSSVPPVPAGLAAQGALATINLHWDPTNNTNIGTVQIWRALDNDLAAAAPVGETAGLGRVFPDVIGAAGRFYYWIRYISKANIPGPFNSTDGTLGTTGTGAEHLLDLLKDQITESELFGELRDRIDLVDAEGTGLVDRVDALVEIYGDTASSAESAVQAIEAAEAAIAAKAAAIRAAGDSAGAASVSQSARLAAEAANQAAGSAASAASTSVENASSYATAAESAAAASNTSKVEAEAARSGADTAAAAAVTARDTAVTKANQAGESAGSASTSASTASTKAGDAAAAATRAASSESNAAGSASSASTSATNAANSANSVGGSAQAAAGSASTAATHADNAGNSAAAANAAKVAAESARDGALQSANAASTSASTANTKAGDAGWYANAASQSANTASTAAGDALTYKNSAAQSVVDAQGHASASARDYTAINARLNNSGGSGVSIEQKLEVTASDVDGLKGQAVLVIDNNGYVVGWGLASEIIDGQPTSSFIVNAANFAFVTPGAAPQVMFSGGIVNGQPVVGFSGTLIGPSGELGNLRMKGAIYAGSYTADYSWPTSGGGFHLSQGGALFGDHASGNYFQIEANGSFYTPKMRWANGVFLIDGALIINPQYAAFSLSVPSNTSGGTGAKTVTLTCTATVTGAAKSISWTLHDTSTNGSLSIVSGANTATVTIRSLVSVQGANLTNTGTLTCTAISSGDNRADIATSAVSVNHI